MSEDFWVLQIRRVLGLFLAFLKLKCSVLYADKDEKIKCQESCNMECSCN